MRVMVFVKATEDSEKGISPTPETAKLFEAMGKFNEELSKAGVLLGGRRPETLLERQACRVQRSSPHGHRWAFRRNPRTGRGLLAVGGEGHG